MTSQGASYSTEAAGELGSYRLCPAPRPCPPGCPQHGGRMPHLRVMIWAQLILAVALCLSGYVIYILPFCMPQRHQSPGLSHRIILGTESYKNTWSKRNLTNKLHNDPLLPTGHSHRIMGGGENNCPPFLSKNSTTSGQRSGNTSFSLSVSSLRLCGEHTSVGPMPPGCLYWP